MVTVTTVMVRCSQLTTDVWILCIFQGNAEHLKEPDLHTDFFPILLTRNHTNKNPKHFCVSSRRHQLVAQAKRIRSPTPRSCARAVPHPAASRGPPRPLSSGERHLSQSGRAAHLLKEEASDAPTTESLQKSKGGKPWRGETVGH